MSIGARSSFHICGPIKAAPHSLFFKRAAVSPVGREVEANYAVEFFNRLFGVQPERTLYLFSKVAAVASPRP